MLGMPVRGKSDGMGRDETGWDGMGWDGMNCTYVRNLPVDYGE